SASGPATARTLAPGHRAWAHPPTLRDAVRRATVPGLRSAVVLQPGSWSQVKLNEADGVFQGGGVKGIALVGALLGFAERGYNRWVNVAGTSAGAFVAAYLACGHDAYDTEQLLRSAPYSRFEDFGPG